MGKLLFSAAVVVALLVGFTAPAAASPPAAATGTFAILSDTQTLIRTVGSTSYYNEVATLSYAGDLTGAAGDKDIFILHSDGSFEAYGTEICRPCTIGHRTGVFTSVFAFHASGTQYAEILRFTRGSGGLVGLHGGGVFQGNDVGSIYSYNYAFVPTSDDDRFLTVS